MKKAKDRDRENGKQVVVQQLRQRGWELVADVDQFAQSILAGVAASAADRKDAKAARRRITRETLRGYSSLLYECLRSEDPKRKTRAFEELWEYLYPIALYKTRDEGRAKEVAQRALIKAWEKGSQCRDPDRFLGWAKVVLLSEIRMEARRAGRTQTVAWSQGGEDGRETLLEQMVRRASREGISARPVESGVFRDKAVQHLRRALAAALESEARRFVIEAFFIEGLGFKAIAEKLETTPSNVYTLKSRALAQLRDDEEFRRILSELVGD